MAPLTEVDENVKYLVLIMKHSEFKPNYHAVATEAAINNANNAQKRFKKLVESAGFALVNGAVVSPDGSGAVPITPKKPKAKKSATPATKKRKIQAVEGDGETEDGIIENEMRSEDEVRPEENGN